MANFMYNTAAHEVHNQTLNLATEAAAGDLKVMLVNSSYTPDRDHDTVSQAVAGEISATGYTGGHGGAGRKAVANGALGGASNDTIVAAILFQEKTSDADSRLVYYIDTVSGYPELPFTTVGGEFSLQIGADGWAHLKTNP
jgi:hypothetical protein